MSLYIYDIYDKEVSIDIVICAHAPCNILGIREIIKNLWRLDTIEKT